MRSGALQSSTCILSPMAQTARLFEECFPLLYRLFTFTMCDLSFCTSLRLGVPDLFLGTIIIPIVGNAAEHAAAIIFASKNKMELALGIAVGSATQIALLVLPLCVVIAWMLDLPLSMDFHAFETGTLLLTVLLVASLVQVCSCPLG